MPSVYIIEVKRSPIGKTNEALSHIRPEGMMSQLLNSLTTIHNQKVDDLIIASAVGLGGNLARLSLLEAGMAMTTTATSLDFQCGGSLKALEYGYYGIASGCKDLVIVGGVESTSQEPRIFLNPSDPCYHGEVAELRGKFSPDAIGDPDMLQGAENCYSFLKPVKEEIDEIVLESHRRAVLTRDQGFLRGIIVPMKGRHGDYVYDDESIRDKMSQRLINRSSPLVKEGGYTSVMNACLTHDGASIIVLASEEMVKKLKVKPLVEIVGIESVGLNPNYSPLGALVASQKLMTRYGLDNEDLAAIEVNEAFALKTWSIKNYLGIDYDRINPLGGALAYGHPYGATGGILIGHLLVSMAHSPKPYGMATMGVAGGQGIAVLVRQSYDRLD
jgi:acetyl-CoA C-acetyltransferase